jgi:hypothetical protein
VTSLTYSSTAGTPAVSTPAANYCYDGLTWNGSACAGSRAAPFKGRLTEVRSAVSSHASDRLRRSGPGDGE